jgi:hypothetical protein
VLGGGRWGRGRGRGGRRGRGRWEEGRGCTIPDIIRAKLLDKSLSVDGNQGRHTHRKHGSEISDKQEGI